MCHDEEPEAIWCGGGVTIGGKDGFAHVNLDKKRVVESISIKFKPDDFDSVSEAIIKKYGKPKVLKSIISNAMGASFAQVEMEWKNKTAIMVLRKYDDKIDEGNLWVVTNKKLKEYDQKNQKNKSDI